MARRRSSASKAKQRRTSSMGMPEVDLTRSSRSLTLRDLGLYDVPQVSKEVVHYLYQTRYNRLPIEFHSIAEVLINGLNNPAFFSVVIVDEKDAPVGGMAATLNKYIFNDVWIAEDQLLFVKEGYRSIRSVSLLLNAYKKWAKQKGVDMATLRTSVDTPGFDKIAEKFGFKFVGATFELEIDHETDPHPDQLQFPWWGTHASGQERREGRS